MKPVIIAHRGASALATHENSLEAFQIAIELGADLVEFDIRQTRDRKLIVFHDSHYMGTPVSALTYNDLCTRTGSYGFTPPLLCQVLSLCKGKIRLDIELKETGFEADVLAMVKKDYTYREFSIKSFHDQVCTTVKALDPKVYVGLLVGKKNVGIRNGLQEQFPLKRLTSSNADFISPHYLIANSFFIWKMNRCNYPIYVWTVNTPRQIKHFLKKKISGIITDHPDIALRQRKNI